ncbi:SURF1 family cytochrome oxidase biogenesis protein [Saccharomonospora sp.]|uniref:SURF1 family cytochrome oxidase biogenesis protein n=1 Tax=Saccharomonospora sp. TaxID=33913 RepID=UPI0026383CAB|nr:SURF1 family cytochrome oxidase biogenesis protein [Saccharomonospora sp.]
MVNVRWKLLLRPGWLALTLAVFGFAVLCYTVLAPWQFDRHTGRSEQNAAVEASFTQQPSPLEEVLAPGQRPDRETEWRRVMIEGTYLPEHEIVARLRTVQGEPAFEVLTPLRTTSDRVVLINRGYLRPDNGDVPPYAAPPTGVVRVEARVRADEIDPQQRAPFADASTQGKLHTYVVNSATVGQATGLDISPGYLQLVEEQPGVLNALPLPTLEAGPYLSYALQWVAFGTMAILGWAYFTVRELKPGGVLAEERGGGNGGRRRKSVAEMLAEDEENAANTGNAADEKNDAENETADAVAGGGTGGDRDNASR